VTIDEIFASFCARGIGRYAMDVPFRRCGFTYATDGRACVRTTQVVQGAAEHQKAPDPRAIGWHDARDEEVTPLPELTVEHMCKNCKGTGRYETCPDCNGTGQQECDLGHEHDCPDCGASGQGGVCAECYRGYAQVGVTIRSNYRLTAGQIARLRDAGVTAVRLPTEAHGPAYFSGDGFDGLVVQFMG